ncbi:dihydrodipicolinate reductase [Pseudooceanicola nanhaiensis]|uniref:dihydrodipicolinate reductase n=1 Tax=Pseudooceanicola nanhaiensis TaxID=375761 RepID=UPI001CD232BF|nr:dihydrodipicolinate reductase [Pseudooceanicola nanhaiensis]MCA0921366.1 dihydrodipicolinate reductase [Pseudooceanicola nanhaiensis]
MAGALLLTALLGSGLRAETAFDRVESREGFVAQITGRELTYPGIRLQVSEAGRIDGRAFGRPVTGDWRWKDGYFCRTMVWGRKELAYNCQLVEKRAGALRFTSDRGAGDSAVLSLR